MMMPVPLMTRRSVDAVAGRARSRTSSAARPLSNARRSLRSVSRWATTASLTRVAAEFAISAANASPERIRSTDGMRRGARNLPRGPRFRHERSLVAVLYARATTVIKQ